MKLSIITVNLNNAAGLEKTMQSVVSQSYRDFEYIIIDGGSTDDSRETIQKYSHQIKYWVSEKDNGIYHAMNKGIKVANGEYLFMLNSGDHLVSEDVLAVLFSNQPTTDFVYTNLFLTQNGEITERRHPAKLSFQFFRDEFISHQAIFIRKALHQKVGMYDESLKIVSDWKFMMLAICKHNATYKHFPLQLSYFEWDGLSTDPKSWQLVLAEKKKVFEEEFSAYLPDYAEFDRVRKELDLVNKKIYVRINRRLVNFFSGKPFRYFR